MLRKLRKLLNAKPRYTPTPTLCILIVGALYWWYPASHVAVETVIPVTVVRLCGHHSAFCMSHQQGIAAVEGASRYWEQYGIKLQVVGVDTINSCAWSQISGNGKGLGETTRITRILEAEYNTLVVVLPEGFTELDGSGAPYIAGLASVGRNGFALAMTDWRVAAHEMAHVLCGCYHTRWFIQPNNILESGLSNDHLPKEEIRLTAWQAYVARKHAKKLAARYSQ